MTTLPEQLLQDFSEACSGHSDKNPFEVLYAILDDVLDSMRLALTATELSQDQQRDVVAEVQDYIVNHYEEES